MFLVPGLLGFENISTFSYFAERVTAALRAALEQRLMQPVSVIALPIPPTDSLANRQRKLVKSLADRLEDVDGEQTSVRVHLVGHSTGGLDANLLLQDSSVEGRSWAELDARAPSLRERIDTIISIASPHQGACVTRDQLAQLVGSHDVRGLDDAALVGLKFLWSAVHDTEVSQLGGSVLREAGKGFRMLQALLKPWPLIADLDPMRVPAKAALTRNVKRRSFVTITGTPIDTKEPGPDALFQDFYARATGQRTGSSEVGPLVRASLERLQHAVTSEPQLVIRAPGVALPDVLDTRCNDGVVNSARQLMDPTDPHELAGIVVADHFDVVGYYDRTMWIVDDAGRERAKHAISGLLHSGCAFRDDEFFDLYRRVAAEIA